MDSICFHQFFDDFEDFSESVTWDLEFEQLSRGTFHSDIAFFADTDFQIGLTVFSVALSQRGTVPSVYTFAVNHPDFSPIIWRYQDFPPDGIIVFPENREHYGLSQPYHRPFTVTVSEPLLCAVSEKLGLPEPDRFVKKGAIFRCDPLSISRIQATLARMISSIKSAHLNKIQRSISSEQKEEATRMILSALAASVEIRSRKRRMRSRRESLNRVLEYIDSDLTTNRSIAELCIIAETDERTLRNMFYERFSLSPIRYCRYHRLNRVRETLRRSDDADLLVTDIANAHGFWHMGQFAKEYSALFGELPSATRLQYTSSPTRRSPVIV